MIKDFLVENFRTFRRLELRGLGRVTLVVGRNNVGKTMLLEALRLYAADGDPGVVFSMLADRDEFTRLAPSPRPRRVPPSRRRLPVSLQALFHRRLTSLVPGCTTITLGHPDTPDDCVRLSLGSALRDKDDDGQIHLRFALAEFDGQQYDTLAINSRKARKTSIVPFPADTDYFPYPDWEDVSGGGAATALPCFVPAKGLTAARLERWWDSVALTDAESRVVQCLRIVAPVERLGLVQNPAGDERYAIVKLEQEEEPVPLRALGDGMGRMFAIALALENARPSGLLLIDEVENGIHYAVLPDLWRFIATAAHTQGIQVVATSHSWDCVAGFQCAAREIAGAEGVLVRLFEDAGTIDYSRFSQSELDIITRDRIEVR